MDGVASVLTLPILGVLKALPYALFDFAKQLVGLEPVYIPLSGLPGSVCLVSFDPKA